MKLRISGKPKVSAEFTSILSGESVRNYWYLM